jgi:hypothetical protein
MMTGLVIMALSVGERPRRVVEYATGKCLEVEVPTSQGVERKPCQWLESYTGLTDEDLPVGMDR